MILVILGLKEGSKTPNIGRLRIDDSTRSIRARVLLAESTADNLPAIREVEVKLFGGILFYKKKESKRLKLALLVETLGN